MFVSVICIFVCVFVIGSLFCILRDFFLKSNIVFCDKHLCWSNLKLIMIFFLMEPRWKFLEILGSSSINC